MMPEDALLSYRASARHRIPHSGQSSHSDPLLVEPRISPSGSRYHVGQAGPGHRGL